MQRSIYFAELWKIENEPLRKQVVHFWQHIKALPSGVNAEERSRQLLYVALSEKEVIGVSTAFQVKVPSLNNNTFYHYRCLIHPDYRIPGLMDKITVLSRDKLEEYNTQTHGTAVGVVTLIENPDLLKRREAVWPSTKLIYMGSTNSGRDIRVYYFKGARI